MNDRVASMMIIIAAERYLDAVRRLSETAPGENKSYFEVGLLVGPDGDEGIRRWRELNDSGVALREEISAAKAKIGMSEAES